jgi:hypothetical protein
MHLGSHRRGGDRAVRVGVERQPAAGAEAVVAAVNRGAARAGGDPNFAQHCHRPTIVQAVFESAQFGVDLAQRRKLGENQRVVALAEAVQIEYEPTEIAVGELACLAQEAGAATHAPALAEAWLRRLFDRGLGLRRLLPGILCSTIGGC